MMLQNLITSLEVTDILLKRKINDSYYEIMKSDELEILNSFFADMPGHEDERDGFLVRKRNFFV